MVEIEGRPLFIDNRDGNTLARAILTALSSTHRPAARRQTVSWKHGVS